MINKYNIQTGQIIDANNITLSADDNKTIEQRLYELSSTDYEAISSEQLTIKDEIKGLDGETINVEKGFSTKTNVPVEISKLATNELSSIDPETSIKVNNELIINAPLTDGGAVNLLTLKEKTKPVREPGENIDVTTNSSYILENNLDSRILSQGPWLGCTVYIFNRTGYPQIITTEGKDVLVENNNDLYWVWTGSEWKNMVAGSQLDLTDIAQVIKGSLFEWLPDEEGIFAGMFNETKAPWSITFTEKENWKLRYAQDSVVFKTESNTDETRDLRGIQQAGLPNIEGSWSTDLNGVAFLPMGSSTKGSLYTQTLNETNTFQPTSGFIRKDNTTEMSLDASLSSSVYGNSDTVTPKNVLVRIYEYIGESIYAKAVKQQYADFEADDIVVNHSIIAPDPIQDSNLVTLKYLNTEIGDVYSEIQRLDLSDSSIRNELSISESNLLGEIDNHTVDFGLGTSCAYPPNNDWNQAVSNGWYMSSSAANAPTTNWFMGLVTVHNANWIRQELTRFSTGTGTSTPHVKYVRQSYDSGGSIVWGPWFMEDTSMRTLTTLSSTLATNTIYSIGNRGSNIAITSASGFGELRFNATANITLSIPSSHRWAIGTNTSFVSGYRYVVSWADSIWMSIAADF